VTAAKVWAAIREQGIELAVREGRLCARPSAGMTQETRLLVQQHRDGLIRLLAENQEAPRLPLNEWGDLRPCTLCRKLAGNGRCLSAFRGELRAARDYSPSMPGKPRRCFGYDPKPEDPEQSPGRERWPYLAEWEATIPD